MKTFTLSDINENIQKNPREFIAECENNYTMQIENVVDMVLRRLPESPIILINGPSSSGKTTTSRRIQQCLEGQGKTCYTISMDDYYLNRNSIQFPLDEEGNVDLESPLCMDLPLLNRHLEHLVQGEEIAVPQYDFITKCRTNQTKKIHLESDTVVVIEGLHALNDSIVGSLGDRATGVYISLEAEVVIEEEPDFVLGKNMLRFVRRAIRDYNFRGASIEKTIAMWKSVVRGEKLYIAPFKKNAAIKINSYMPYESGILMPMIHEKLKGHQKDLESIELGSLLKAVDLFAAIEYQNDMPKDSLLHEFIG